MDLELLWDNYDEGRIDPELAESKYYQLRKKEIELDSQMHPIIAYNHNKACVEAQKEMINYLKRFDYDNTKEGDNTNKEA